MNKTLDNPFRLGLRSATGEASFLRRVLGHLLTALAVGGAFTVSAFNKIGPGIVPLIDMGHFFAMIGVFASGVYIFGLLYYKIAELTTLYIPLLLATIKVTTYRVKGIRRRPISSRTLSRIADGIRERNIKSIAISSIIFAIFIFVLGGFVGSQRSILALSRSMNTEGSTAIIFGGFVLLTVFIFYIRAEVGKRVSSAIIFASAFRIVLVVTSFLAGATWINWIRDAGPRSVIFLGDQTLVASIAFPAIEGLILFKDGERTARYIPWTRITEARPISQAELDDIRSRNAAQSSSTSISPSPPTSLK